MENLKNPEDHIGEVLKRVKRDYIFNTYKIESWAGVDNFLEQLCKKSGRLLKVCRLLLAFLGWATYHF